jgi:hypothetical protein
MALGGYTSVSTQNEQLDLEQALRVHAVSELGLDPAGKPSPVIAAVSSFSRFAVGAVVPLLTYLFGAPRLWPALLLGGRGDLPDRAGDRRPARSARGSHFERQAFFRRRMSHSRMTTRITAEPSR